MAATFWSSDWALVIGRIEMHGSIDAWFDHAPLGKCSKKYSPNSQRDFYMPSERKSLDGEYM